MIGNYLYGVLDSSTNLAKKIKFTVLIIYSDYNEIGTGINVRFDWNQIEPVLAMIGHGSASHILPHTLRIGCSVSGMTPLSESSSPKKSQNFHERLIVR